MKSIMMLTFSGYTFWFEDKFTDDEKENFQDLAEDISKEFIGRMSLLAKNNIIELEEVSFDKYKGSQSE
jgi:hypothetical protein